MKSPFQSSQWYKNLSIDQKPCRSQHGEQHAEQDDEIGKKDSAGQEAHFRIGEGHDQFADLAILESNFFFQVPLKRVFGTHSAGIDFVYQVLVALIDNCDANDTAVIG